MTGGAGTLGPAFYFMRKESQRIDELIERHRRRMKRKAHRVEADEDALVDRLDEVEGDLGRLLLLAMSANRLLVRKRVLTTGEIAAVARRIDLADGVADGKLDPAVVRPPAAARPEEMPPEEFLRNLEKEDRS